MKKYGATDPRPRYMVWENVPGAFNSNDGEDFRTVLEETARVADSSAAIPRPEDGWSNSGAIMGEGWSIAWRVHDAQFWGVPQRRRRIALVADFGGYTAPEILFERHCLSGNTPKSEEARKGVASNAEERLGGSDTEIFTLDRAAFNQGENAKYDFAVDNNGISPTLVARGELLCDARGNGDGNISPTLTGDHQSRVTDYTALCFNILQDPISSLDRSPCLSAGNSKSGQSSLAVCIGNGQADQLKISEKVGALNCMHDQQAVLVAGVKSSMGAKAHGIGYEEEFAFIEQYSRYALKRPGTVFGWSNPKLCEVIGNIHDNPELLRNNA